MDLVSEQSYCCQVCGDVATCYRLYGAKSVCYSCRIFFRRAVKSSQNYTCKLGSTVPCVFDKSTRNHCKKCRYEACLSVGMVVHLVDSCRKHSNPPARLDKNILSTIEDTQVQGFAFNKNLAIRKFEKICEELFFSPEHYSLIDIDKHCIDQIRDKKFLISAPADSMSRTFEFFHCAITKFLKVFLPRLAGETVDLITRNVSLTVIGISCCAFNSFSSQTLLEQYQNSCIIGSEYFWDHYKKVFPDIENLKPVPIQSYDLWSSPYAHKFEDEQFFEETAEKFSQLLKGDLELGKILYLLALVSPVKLELDNEEVAQLKEFQKSISIMIYNHLMSKSELDNFSVLQMMYQFVSLLEDLNRCGEIFQKGLINHGDQHEGEIESINIEQF